VLTELDERHVDAAAGFLTTYDTGSKTCMCEVIIV
jgi:hypothetical protein